MASSLVSTIVPVYNRSRFLEESVGSAMAQTYRPIEIILVDDGSTDDTPDTVRHLIARDPGVVRGLRVPHGGPGQARQAGWLAARGEYIQYLDSDDRLAPRKFERQVGALESAPQCGACYGITRLIDRDGRELECPYKGTGERRDRLFPRLLVDRWWNTQTPLWRRSVCEAIAPWPDMGVCEDWVMDARAGGLGVELAFVDEVVADTRCHRTGGASGPPGSPSLARDVSRLLHELHAAALRLRLPGDLPEMMHFSRWAFLQAREAGRMGLTEEARRNWRLAVAVARSSKVSSLGLRAYGVLAGTVGWRRAASWSEKVRGAVR